MALIGVAMIAFPMAFAQEPKRILVSLNPVILIAGLLIYGVAMIFAQLPDGLKRMTVRVLGALALLGGGAIAARPHIELHRAADPPPPTAVVEAAPAPRPVAEASPTPPPPTEADADGLIAQASAAWRSGDKENAVRCAREAHRIRTQLFGAEHPKVREVERMLAMASGQPAGK